VSINRAEIFQRYRGGSQKLLLTGKESIVSNNIFLDHQVNYINTFNVYFTDQLFAAINETMLP